MKKSIALIQPTLFEGGPGGGSVYDAIAHGVPCIVSDIPVNMEIEDDNVLFFKAGSSDDLSMKMIELLNKGIKKPDNNLLLAKSEERALKLGDSLFNIINFTIENYKLRES
jgi:glycosyltransferase involved in cell wall biosynthesis